MLTAVRQDLALDLPAEQVVGRLQGLDRAGARELGHLRDVEVGDADVADLALVDERAQRLGGLGERRRRIGPVHLVEVDVLDAEILEALLHTAPHEARAGVTVQLAALHAQAALGGDDQLGAARAQLVGERAAEDALGHSEAVGLRGVEEVDPEVQGLADRGDGGGLVDVAPIPAELPCPVGDRRDLQL